MEFLSDLFMRILRAKIYQRERDILPDGCNISRRRGGWIKRVDSLDKTKTDGYSLVGPFINEGPQWVTEGYYVDCSIDGSKSNHTKTYNLFHVGSGGEITLLKSTPQKGGWATLFWDEIEKPSVVANPLAGYSSRELFDELERRHPMQRVTLQPQQEESNETA